MNRKLLIFSLGRDIAASAEKVFGRSADAIIKMSSVTMRDYPVLRKQAYVYLKEWQLEQIDIVFSGPLAFAFTFGQIVGINHFDVTVFQYDAENRIYLETPKPTREEIN